MKKVGASILKLRKNMKRDLSLEVDIPDVFSEKTPFSLLPRKRE
jgi:hypothetical protein